MILGSFGVGDLRTFVLGGLGLNVDCNVLRHSTDDAERGYCEVEGGIRPALLENVLKRSSVYTQTRWQLRTIGYTWRWSAPSIACRRSTATNLLEAF